MNQNILSTTLNISIKIVRNYARRVKVANPGLQKQLNVLQEKEHSLEDVDLEELESDFMNLKETHKQHENELKYYREKEKFWIVKQKYFKENKVNFLTWNDKEQIRYLHQSNPEEWTIERLSEGFPASPETISKIIKNKWQVKNEAKKANHDNKVHQNWKLLREGKFSEVLPPNLFKHLMKFSSRDRNTILENATKIVSTNFSPNSNEFSSIVTNYKHSKVTDNIDMKIENINECKEINEIESRLKSFGNKNITLNMVKNDEPKNLSTENNEVNVLEKLFPKNKYETAVTDSFDSNNTDSKLVTYPERIKIPKDKYKKGFTYKVNDCYYDDDGEFLYRVPGLY